MSHNIVGPSLEEHGQRDVAIRGEETIVDLSLEHLEFADDLVAGTGGDVLATRPTIGSAT
jgi:hypothetical protein